MKQIKYVAASVLVMATFVFASDAYAGKMELTTYYPAPNGEYGTLKASKSFIPPQMTTTQRDNIKLTSKPPLAEGMVIYNKTTFQLEIYNSSAWEAVRGNPPKMTTTERDSVSSTSIPPLTQGMLIYNMFVARQDGPFF